MTFESKRRDEPIDEADRYEVMAKPKSDLSKQRVFCVFCNNANMKFLPGMPLGHSQWVCESCGSMAYEGYGDTPARDTEYRTIASLNDPYPMDDPDSIIKPTLKDIDIATEPELEQEGDKDHLAKVDSKSGKHRMRYGLRYAYQSAEEATKEI